MVGYVDLHGDGAAERELGFVIGERAKWGRGLGAQAARAGLRCGFTELGLNSIWAEAVDLNVRSIRVLDRVGMAETGVGDAASFRGQPSHYRRFAISATEWAGRTEAETQ